MAETDWLVARGAVRVSAAREAEASTGDQTGLAEDPAADDVGLPARWEERRRFQNPSGSAFLDGCDMSCMITWTGSGNA
jgi:hypothetical protein